MEIEKKVLKVIAAVLGMTPEQLRVDASLKDDLGATSLDRYTILMDLEDAFSLELDDVPEEELEENIRTVRDIIDFLAQRLEDRAT